MRLNEDSAVAVDQPGDAVEVGDTDRRTISPNDFVGLTVVGIVPIALLPGFFFPSNPRQALLVAALPLGTWLLCRMILHRDRAACAAGLFLVVALAAALRSEFRLVALLGTTSTELSFIALVSAFGCWAVGRNLSSLAVARLPVVFTMSAALSAAVGIFQVVLNPTTGLYQTHGGRMSGLTSNPVFFASTFVGIWIYWFVRAAQSGRRHHLALTASLAASVALTGSRGATAVGLLFVVVALITRRHRQALSAAAASLVGVAIGFGVLTALDSGQSDRLADANSAAGLRLRLEVWKSAARIVSERPVLGWGPNPYLHRLNTAMPDVVYRDYGSRVWLDPHNVLLLVLVTTGLLGLVALAVFVALALRGRVDLALLAAAVAIVGSWLLQPVVLTSWPIAFALLGAAVRPVDPDDGRSSPPSGVVPTALLITGIIAGLLYAGWSVQFRSAIDERDPDRIETSAGWLLRDPEVAIAVAQFHKNANAGGGERDRHLARAEALAADVVDRTSTRASWNVLTETKVIRGDVAGALATARAWAAEWPHDPLAHGVVAFTADAADDSIVAAQARSRICEITDQCDASTGGG